MRPRGRDVENVGDHLPALLRVERHRRDAGVAPDQDGPVLGTERLQREAEEGAADASPDDVRTRRHATELPRGPAVPGLRHQRGAPDRVAAREKGAEVQRSRIVVALEVRGVERQTLTKLAVPEREDLLERDATDGERGCAVHHLSPVIRSLPERAHLAFHLVETGEARAARDEAAGTSLPRREQRPAIERSGVVVVGDEETARGARAVQ